MSVLVLAKPGKLAPSDCPLGGLQRYWGTIVDDALPNTERLPLVCQVQYDYGLQEYCDLRGSSLRWL